MDSGTYSCDVNETFTMRVLDCEDSSTPDEVNIKAEKITDNSFIQDDDPQLEKQSVSDLGENFQSRPPDEQILTHPEKALLELNFNAEPEKNTILQCQSKLPNEVNVFKSVPKNAVKRSRTKTYKIDFKCCYCKKIFLQKGRLDKHLLIHENKIAINNKRLTCTECGKKFTDTRRLNRHTLTRSCVKQKETLECSECGKTFSRKSFLVRHKLIHSGIKPFECHYCNKRFLLKQYLKQHITIHTGEKKIKCKECNFKFRFRSDLSKHIHRFHLKK